MYSLEVHNNPYRRFSSVMFLNETLWATT